MYIHMMVNLSNSSVEDIEKCIRKEFDVSNLRILIERAGWMTKIAAIVNVSGEFSDFFLTDARCRQIEMAVVRQFESENLEHYDYLRRQEENPQPPVGMHHQPNQQILEI